MIRVSEEDFDVGNEVNQLTLDNPTDGAVVTFIGLVRDFNQGESVTRLHLEHYPKMTEKVLNDIVRVAKEKWSLGKVRVIHRVGTLEVNEQIVFVGVTSVHREDAFQAAAYIMDFLKTKAPFWKKESINRSNENNDSRVEERWVEAQQKDLDSIKQW